MILHQETVEQAIEGRERGTFLKELVLATGPQPIAMVRKRSASRAPSRGAVILLHGFGQNRYAWHLSRRSFANHLAHVGHDVFNVDLRGHGRSRRLGARRPRTLDEYIQEDLPAAVREVLRVSGEERVFLLGHSMGGLLCYAAAATLGAKVRGVISFGSPYRFGSGSTFLSLLALALEGATWRGPLARDWPIPLRPMSKALASGRSRLLSTLLLPIQPWRTGALEPEMLTEYLHRSFDFTSLSVALGIVRGGRRGRFESADRVIDYGARFEALDVPLLVVAGSRDRLAPPDSVRPAHARSRSSDKTYRELPLGHADLLIGKQAPLLTWPLAETWMNRR
ncbi:MAG: alpha/beta hydrolase [Deltaproteobacteria bacterium]|nr:alpha/beta hydrolase [Deltaproteobacteria bacterium]